MSIFASHAASNFEIVREFVNLLQLGMGVPHRQIFCSSTSGTIPVGTFFVQNILTALHDSELVIALLSLSYFDSQFCLAEAGAAQVKQIAAQRQKPVPPPKFYLLLIPPAGFTDLQGALHGVQAGVLNVPADLDNLRDRVAAGGGPATAVWNTQRDSFLRTIAPLLERELASRKLAIQDLWIERVSATNTGTTYKAKLRIVFTNGSTSTIQVSSPTWAPTAGVHVQRPECARIQLEGPKGWQNNDWLGEATSVAVPPGKSFRIWLGLDPSVSEKEMRRRHEVRNLGTLTLPLSVAGYNVPLQFPL
jgi:hypothetical protein